MKSKQDYVDALDSLKCLAFQHAIACVKDLHLNPIHRHFAAGVIFAAFSAGAITKKEADALFESFAYGVEVELRRPDFTCSTEAANDSRI